MRIVAGIAAFALVACATPDPMAAYYRGTVLVSQTFGEVDHLQLPGDRTYVMYGQRFPVGHGAWAVDKGKVCLMPGDTPETRGQRFCNPWGGCKVGDKWTIQIGGQTAPMELAPGRLGPLPPSAPPH